MIRCVTRLCSVKNYLPISARNMSAISEYKFETLSVTQPKEWVLHVEMNRPKKLNAMNRAYWKELPQCFEQIGGDSNCRCVVLSGSGRIFTAGLDLMDHIPNFQAQDGEDVSRRAFRLQGFIRAYQHTFTAIEKCSKPVIAAVHNACIGGGMDLITACDMRYGTTDSYYQVKEVDIGLAADVGTLQRLPKVVGSDSLARELVYSARKMFADEAHKCGLVSRLFDDKDAMMAGAVEMAELISTKSPVAVQGSKISMVYSRDHSVPEGLEHVGLWNSCMLQSEDSVRAAMAGMNKEQPVYSKL